MSAINLIPRRVRETAAVRRRVRRWAIGGAVYALALVFGCGVLRLVGGEEHTRLSLDGGRLAERIASAETALAAVRAQVQDQRRQLEASETVGVHPDWSILLSALAEERRQDIILQAIELRAADPPSAARAKADPAPAGEKKPTPRPERFEAYTLHVKGFGLSQGDVVKFVRRLEELGPLAEVQLKETRAQPFRGVPAIAFDADCRLSERRVTQAEPEQHP